MTMLLENVKHVQNYNILITIIIHVRAALMKVSITKLYKNVKFASWKVAII